MKINNAFKTGKSLQWAIDNSEKVEGMDDYLDSHFAYLNLDLDYGSTPTWEETLNNGELFEVPYWASDGAIDYAINGNLDYDPEFLMAEYIPGYYEPHNYGDTLVKNGKEYRYIASIGLPEETEHRAENGKLAYEYRGSSFLRILEPVEKIIDKEYPR